MNVQVSARWIRSRRTRAAPSIMFTRAQDQAASRSPPAGVLSHRTRGSSGAPVRQRWWLSWSRTGRPASSSSATARSQHRITQPSRLKLTTPASQGRSTDGENAASIAMPIVSALRTLPPRIVLPRVLLSRTAISAIWFWAGPRSGASRSAPRPSSPKLCHPLIASAGTAPVTAIAFASVRALTLPGQRIRREWPSAAPGETAPLSHLTHRESAAAAGPAAAASAGGRTASGTGAPAGREPAHRDRRQELDRVVMPLRAGALSRRLGHRPVQLERVAAGAAAVLIAGHGPSLAGQSSRPVQRPAYPPDAAPVSLLAGAGVSAAGDGRPA